MNGVGFSLKNSINSLGFNLFLEDFKDNAPPSQEDKIFQYGMRISDSTSMGKVSLSLELETDKEEKNTQDIVNYLLDGKVSFKLGDFFSKVTFAYSYGHSESSNEKNRSDALNNSKHTTVKLNSTVNLLGALTCDVSVREEFYIDALDSDEEYNETQAELRINYLF